MFIDWIEDNAARFLLSALENGDAIRRGALYFRTPSSALPLDVDDVVRCLYPTLRKHEGTVYRFDDGHMLITWSQSREDIADTLRNSLYEYFDLEGDETLDTFYDFAADAEDLRVLALSKMPAGDTLPVTPPPAIPVPPLTAKASVRRSRSKPSILMIGRDSNAQKLLVSIIGLDYVYHSATTAEQALETYAAHCPSIAFVDTDLGGMGGHATAAILRRNDPESFVVMVASSQDENDIQRARENGVQGFILKPFSKQKLDDILRKFTKHKA